MKLPQTLRALSLALAVTAAPTTVALAQGGPHGGPAMEELEGPPMHGLERLGLSDAQKSQVRELRKKHRDTVRPLREAMIAEREKLGKLMADRAPLEEARAQHAKVHEQATKLADARFEMMYEVMGVLTPEQRQKLHEMKPHRGGKGRRGGWKH